MCCGAQFRERKENEKEKPNGKRSGLRFLCGVGIARLHVGGLTSAFSQFRGVG